MNSMTQKTNTVIESTDPPKAATVNPCRLCAPLGASVAVRGIRGGIPILHGAQGCATYIRRYLISHFREPVDIASSSFGESAVVFGGESNLFDALDNVRARYDPEVIVVATTCLAETIGDDPRLSLPTWHRSRPDSPPVISVSTPSYKAGHSEGYRDTVRAIVKAFTSGESIDRKPAGESDTGSLVMLPPMVSPADLRYLRYTSEAYGLKIILAPDFSDTLDGGAWGEYQKIPEGGTPAEEWRTLSNAPLALEFGEHSAADPTAGEFLEETFNVERIRMPLPIGMEAGDRFHQVLGDFSGQPTPLSIDASRSRLVDAYADAHKYLFGKRIAIACNEHLAPALLRFTAELGMIPVMVASGSTPEFMKRALEENPVDRGFSGGAEADGLEILDDADFLKVEESVRRLKPDLMLSSSKAFRICRDEGIPLCRVDFPVHDRFGGQRLLNLGYEGTQRLLDEITNLILEKRQTDSPVGFSYQ